jgi:phage terminase small subunit
MTDISEQQAAFAEAFVANGGNGTQAAISAGYSEISARQMAYKLTRNQKVMDAIRAEQRRLLSGNLATKALAVLEAILDNADAPLGVKVDACKTLLDRGGLTAKAAETEPEAEKPASEMSLAELEAAVARITAAQRAEAA